MKRFRTSATIAAQPSRVWALLTDARAYPDWNPAVDRIEGRIAPGETIKVFVPVNPGRTFPVKVTEFVPEQRMVWTGGLPAGLFKGVRTFTLSPLAGGTTGFVMEEVYVGPLLPLFGRSIPDLSGAFEQFAAGLKQAAERPA
jgi:uncharacterized protein YndB with AHSA1/START domain